MTKREHFEQWLRYVKPNMTLDWNEQEQYYYHDIVSLMWQAWKVATNKRPTEEGRITKDQKAALLADPETIVDRLRGIYPHGVTYPANPLQKAAADEIEKLRKDAERLDFLDGNKDYSMGWEVGAAPVGNLSVRGVIMGGLPIREAIDVALNKKPPEGG